MKIIKRSRSVLLILLVFQGLLIFSQESQLDKYIESGLTNNLALKQKQLNYHKSVAILKEAKGMFFPDVSFNARYSVAEGGRVIEIPVGDMLNPVYKTLNQILQSDVFPMIENEEEPFLRPHEQETKFSLVQPIFNPSIYYNYKIKQDLVEVKSVSVDVYKRELVAEIKKAYFNYLKTVKVLELYDHTIRLLKENIRVNKSLYNNDKVTIDVVYRSESELSKVRQQLSEAEKNNNSTRAYFNFLINRPLETPVESMTFDEISFPESDLLIYRNNAVKKREELRKLEILENIRENQIKLNKGSYYPTLIGAVDYGIQGEEYRFTDKDDFVLASLVLRWSLFQGNQNNAKLQQSRIEAEITDKKRNEVEQQIGLQVIEAYYDLIAAKKAIASSEDQLEFSKKAFRLVNKKYNQGQSNLLEYIDARTTMTNAEINQILTGYDYLVKFANFERVTGSYKFNQ